jgi:membrane associated rhomboid family serine protease/Tfp pilus assembly protein PilF
MYFFYYFPVGIDAEVRRVPVLTISCAAICVAVFVAHKFFSADVPFDFRNYIYFPGYSNLGPALAAAFLHFDYLHITTNLLYLVLFGRYLEDRLGTAGFVLVFLGAAVVGNVLQGAYNIHVLHTSAGIIGASGGVSGILGAFIVRLRHHRVKIAYWVFAPLLATNKAGKRELHAVAAIGLWVLIQIVRGLVQLEGAASNVAYVTHVAGFAFGVGVAVATGGWTKGRIDGHLLKARRCLRRGDFYGAQDQLEHYAAARPADGESHAALARVRAQCGDRSGARESYTGSCECFLAAARRGDAERVYQEAARSLPDFVLTAGRHLDLCFGLERNLKSDAAIRAYESFVRAYPDHPEAAFALLRAANLHAKQGDLARARDCYQAIPRHYPNDTWAEFAAEHARRLSLATQG